MPGMFSKAYASMKGMCIIRLDLFDEVLRTPNEDRMQKLHPQEVDVSTTPIGVHKPFGVSSPGVRVFSFMLYVRKAFGASL
jgi:hypothetical protein